VLVNLPQSITYLNLDNTSEWSETQTVLCNAVIRYQRNTRWNVISVTQFEHSDHEQRPSVWRSEWTDISVQADNAVHAKCLPRIDSKQNTSCIFWQSESTDDCGSERETEW
jgi:hypothetical protein